MLDKEKRTHTFHQKSAGKLQNMLGDKAYLFILFDDANVNIGWFLSSLCSLGMSLHGESFFISIPIIN